MPRLRLALTPRFHIWSSSSATCLFSRAALGLVKQPSGKAINITISFSVSLFFLCFVPFHADLCYTVLEKSISRNSALISVWRSYSACLVRQLIHKRPQKNVPFTCIYIRKHISYLSFFSLRQLVLAAPKRGIDLHP